METGQTDVVYSKKFLEHKTRMSCEKPLRLEVALESLQNLGMFSTGKCVIAEPRMASIEEISLVHDLNYIEEIRSLCLVGGGYYDDDTYLSKESFEVASLAVGGILKVCEGVFKEEFKNAFGLVRPPGHHVGIYGRAMGGSTNGFCVFNNIAVAASYVLKKKLVKKVLIFDFDVHHGNGTQEIFNRTPEVLFISLHERGIYPGTGFEYEIGEGEGAGYKVNIPLPHGSDDSVYLKAIDEIVMPVAEQFKPNLILVSAGFDGHHSDGISTINLSVGCYIKMVRFMVELAEKHCKGRIVASLEGGYSKQTLSTSLPAAIATMAGMPIEIADKTNPATATTTNKAEENIRKTKKILNQYWKL